jgi:pimeloyl-ACP methyl ester carboxylesterase
MGVRGVCRGLGHVAGAGGALAQAAGAIASAGRGRSTSSPSGCGQRVRGPRLRAERRGGVAMNTMEPKTAMLHGRLVNYVEAGAGPVLLLIHGMAGTYENWQAVIEPLARHHTVVAPDLPGHGGSAPGAGDYSLGALAVGLRDLLVTLGHERATLVGHSLGGGIAMQLAYHFPEITERLVLVSSDSRQPPRDLRRGRPSAAVRGARALRRGS